MRPLVVNFVRRRGIWPWAACALSLGLIFVAAFQSWLALDLMKQQQSAEAEMYTLSARGRILKQPGGLPAGAATEPAYAQDAMALSRLASFDAGRILSALESAQVVGVKVTAIEVLSVEQTARVELELTDPSSILQILEQLNAGSDPSTRWRLLRAQSPTSSTAGSATIAVGVGVGQR